MMKGSRHMPSSWEIPWNDLAFQHHDATRLPAAGYAIVISFARYTS